MWSWRTWWGRTWPWYRARTGAAPNLRFLLTRFQLVAKGHSPCSSRPHVTSIAAQPSRYQLGRAIAQQRTSPPGLLDGDL